MHICKYVYTYFLVLLNSFAKVFNDIDCHMLLLNINGECSFSSMHETDAVLIDKQVLLHTIMDQ
jgi:hypothetical protein